jgi:hypothetical protein
MAFVGVRGRSKARKSYVSLERNGAAGGWLAVLSMGGSHVLVFAKTPGCLAPTVPDAGAQWARTRGRTNQINGFTQNYIHTRVNLPRDIASLMMYKRRSWSILPST